MRVIERVREKEKEGQRERDKISEKNWKGKCNGEEREVMGRLEESYDLAVGCNDQNTS